MGAKLCQRPKLVRRTDQPQILEELTRERKSPSSVSSLASAMCETSAAPSTPANRSMSSRSSLGRGARVAGGALTWISSKGLALGSGRARRTQCHRSLYDESRPVLGTVWSEPSVYGPTGANRSLKYSLELGHDRHAPLANDGLAAPIYSATGIRLQPEGRPSGCWGIPETCKILPTLDDSTFFINGGSWVNRGGILQPLSTSRGIPLCSRLDSSSKYPRAIAATAAPAFDMARPSLPDTTRRPVSSMQSEMRR
jgi:hypothetical protein